MRSHDTSRRALLRLGGVALAGGLAGCTGGSGDGGGGGGGDGGGGDGGGGDGGDSTPTPEPVEADATVTVGPGGDLTFDPAELEVAVGAKVAFVWDSGGHTVTVQQKPFESDWRGTNLQTQDAGFVHTHTFEVAGEYDYYCTPHQSSGMKGTVVVGDAGGSEDEATAEATPSPTPGGEGGTPTPEQY